jgi:hypothetical protein
MYCVTDIIYLYKKISLKKVAAKTAQADQDIKARSTHCFKHVDKQTERVILIIF